MGGMVQNKFLIYCASPDLYLSLKTSLCTFIPVTKTGELTNWSWKIRGRGKLEVISEDMLMIWNGLHGFSVTSWDLNCYDVNLWSMWSISGVVIKFANYEGRWFRASVCDYLSPPWDWVASYVDWYAYFPGETCSDCKRKLCFVWSS